MLGLGLDAWNDVMLVCLAATVVTAAALFISTWIITKLAKQEAQDAKQEFERYKITVAGQIETSRAEAEKAKRGAAEALQKAEEERLARVKIEAWLAPRLLTADQKASLAAALTPFAGTAVDIMIFNSGMNDIIPLSGDITDALTAAGWKSSSRTIIGGNASVTGVLVLTKTGADRNILDAAEVLIASLRAARISTVPWDSFGDEQFPFAYTGLPLRPENAAPIRVYIGSKPY